jgi:hypothetical protein
VPSRWRYSAGSTGETGYSASSATRSSARRPTQADLREPEELSRPAKDRRLHKVDVEGYSQMDRRRIFLAKLPYLACAICHMQ